MPPEGSAERLRRILVLVPWVMAHEGCTVSEVCERFGISPEELATDLDLLFVCGLPPFDPGDLIVAYVEDERVVIQMADYLSRPPRLTRQEALALLIMGRAVAELPGMEEAQPLRTAVGKLSGAVAPAEAGVTQDLAARVEVELESAGATHLGVVRHAIDDRQRLRITYYSYGRGEMSERDVDPLLVWGAAGNWYVSALDHGSGEIRSFRIDRIKEAAPTGERFEPPTGFDRQRAATGPLFTPSPRDIAVTIELSPRAGWLREAVVHERLTELDDGWVRMELRTPHLAWLVNVLLSAGVAARAVAPPELVAAVRDEALRALSLYGAGGS